MQELVTRKDICDNVRVYLYQTLANYDHTFGSRFRKFIFTEIILQIYNKIETVVFV